MPDRLDARCVGGYTLSIYRDGTARFNIPAIEIARLTPKTVEGVKTYINDGAPGLERIGFTLHDHVPNGGMTAPYGRFTINPVLRDTFGVDASVIDGPSHITVAVEGSVLGVEGTVLSVLFDDLADALGVDYDPDTVGTANSAATDQGVAYE